MYKSRRIFLVGCGRVGTALCQALRRSGCRVAGVADVDERAARRVARILKTTANDPELPEQVRTADTVVIAVPDDRIGSAHRQLRRWLRPGQTVLHLSGTLSSDVLGTQPGLGRLALHPVMSFPVFGAENAERIRGCSFTLQGNPAGIRTGRELVRALRGRALVLSVQEKTVFHAACVFASNFLDVVLDGAVRLCREAGISEQQALRVLEPLVLQTARNALALGPPAALSGPAERGDVETVLRHLALLRRRGPELLPMYRTLTARARQMAREKTRSPVRR